MTVDKGNCAIVTSLQPDSNSQTTPTQPGPAHLVLLTEPGVPGLADAAAAGGLGLHLLHKVPGVVAARAQLLSKLPLVLPLIPAVRGCECVCVCVCVCVCMRVHVCVCG